MRDKAREVDSIPAEFGSYEEAAEFWDTHDTTDYLGSFETVPVHAKLKHRRFEVAEAGGGVLSREAGSGRGSTFS